MPEDPIDPEVIDDLDPSNFDGVPTFGIPLDDGTKPDFTPMPFKIVGTDADGKAHEFVFRARAQAPMGSIMGLLGGVDGRGNMNASATGRFIEHILIVDDLDRWRDTLDREDLVFEAEMLGDVGLHFGEVYMNRPLGKVPASGNGAKRTGTISAAKSRGKSGKTSG